MLLLKLVMFGRLVRKTLKARENTSDTYAGLLQSPFAHVDMRGPLVVFG